jgi:hypothetical protein
MKNMWIGGGVALALAIVSPAWADAFGIKMGANPLVLGAELQPENAGKPVRQYLLEKLPKPHPEFELLMLTSSAKTGVCRVAALGRYHNNDASGADIRATFETQRGAFDKQYGTSRTYGKDGKPVASWDFRSGADLPADVRTITLETDSVSATETYLVARFEFTNFGDCEPLM